MHQMRELLYQDKSANFIVISTCVNEGYTLYHVALCPPHDKYCCFFILIAFRLR